MEKKVGLAVISTLLLLPISVFAQETDIGTVADRIDVGINAIKPFLAALSYLMGAVFGLKTGLALKDHSESPQQTPLKRPMTLFVMSSCFFGLPSLFNVGVETLFGKIDKNDRRVIEHGGSS